MLKHFGEYNVPFSFGREHGREHNGPLSAEHIFEIFLCPKNGIDINIMGSTRKGLIKLSGVVLAIGIF